MESPKKRKVVSLVRVSTAKQARDDRNGLPRQIEDIETVCREQNLEIVQSFELKGVTGTMTAYTHVFKQVKKALAAKDIAGLVIPSPDRLSRTNEIQAMADVLAPFVDVVKDSKNKLVFAMEDEDAEGQKSYAYNLMDFEDRSKLLRNLEFAERDRRKIKNRLLRGREKAHRRADSSVFRRPVGINFTRHDSAKNVGTYSYDPEIKKLTKASFRRLLEGEKQATICRTTFYTDADGSEKPLYRSLTQLRHSLQSPFWKGYKFMMHTHTRHDWDEDKAKFLERGKIKLPKEKQIVVEIPELRRSPAVSDAEWDAVQKILAQKQEEYTKNTPCAHLYLANGLLRCEICGHRMYPKPKRNRAGDMLHYYMCSSQGRPGKLKSCGRVMIHRDVVDARITEAVLGLFQSPQFIEARVAESRSSEALQERVKAVARLEKQIASLETEYKTLGKRVGIAPEELVNDIYNRMTEVKRDTDKLQRELDTVRSEIAPVQSESVSEAAKRIIADFEGFRHKDVSRQKEILQKYVTAIRIFDSDDEEDHTEPQTGESFVEMTTDSNIGIIFEVNMATFNIRPDEPDDDSNKTNDLRGSDNKSISTPSSSGAAPLPRISS